MQYCTRFKLTFNRFYVIKNIAFRELIWMSRHYAVYYSLDGYISRNSRARTSSGPLKLCLFWISYSRCARPLVFYCFAKCSSRETRQGLLMWKKCIQFIGRQSSFRAWAAKRSRWNRDRSCLLIFKTGFMRLPICSEQQESRLNNETRNKRILFAFDL